MIYNSYSIYNIVNTCNSLLCGENNYKYKEKYIKIIKYLKIYYP